MNQKEDTERARQGFLTWIDDEPDRELEIPSNQPQEAPIQVLFFVDDEDEEAPPTTYIATAGLCSRTFGWAPGGAELLLCVTGDYKPEELEPLGQLLGHLALALRSVEHEPVPGLVLEVGPIPIFEGMTCLLLASWDQGEGGLLETDPPVRLLSVNPLYEEEAMEVVKLSEEEALAWFDEHGVDVDDPLRDSVFASEFAAASEQTLAALNTQSSFEIAAAMQRMSGSMASWLSAAAPGFFEQFAPPGDDESKPGR
ncbi:MAG: suppressor of fused domain protein [Myxococcales bacterium]|nr:suppressor of fused domain protein [Polyangiaceae bacterium]MDW8250417.1 suppressor of fused domain protein [Myxococcales bacterium]